MGSFAEGVAAMQRLYGTDTALSLATVRGGGPNIRTVNAWFETDAFYIVTYAKSAKMREIAENPRAALCHRLFVAHGTGENLGSPLAPGNAALRGKLRRVFSAFYERHVDEADPHTCILKVRLTDALVFADDFKYRIDFARKTAEKEPFAVDIVF